ncbi:M20 family metallopeptidase [Lutimonas halocynthiae]|uniref:M20 family metallopeptidase n=1 Tax=Lutimonas halocynthiae TaxID=1446477 RepID=UPI0025B4ECE7|nr:M20 family metallopeptidase [Lutimonas halocynthiae]MDN3641126.1 M20 family metallopeptidase [Lutimonas halocynthiae]
MKVTTAKHIEAFLKAHQEEMIDFLKRLVTCESPSHDPESQKEIMKILKETLEFLGFEAQVFPGKKTGGFLYARPKTHKKGAAVQLMVGHCDTVWKKHTLENMPIHDSEERLSGPGVFDMKAGITQMIFAIKALKELEIECNVSPMVLINSDEEIGSFESSNTIKRIARIACRAFILEPPLGFEGKLKTARKGIGKFTLNVTGKPAHAGLNPDEGVSAIIELSHHIQDLFKLNDFKKGITVNVGMIQGGSSANVIAEESQAIVDVRVHNMEDASFIEREILNLKPKHKGVSLKIDGGFGRPPMERTLRNQKLWLLARDIAENMSLTLDQATAGGGSDGNTTSLYTATLDGLGTVGDGAHARHEFIFKDKLIERTTLLAMLLSAENIEEELRVEPKNKIA